MKRSYDKRALKRLGMTATEVLDTSYQENNGVGRLALAEHGMFWGQVDGDVKELTEFVLSMVKKLNSLLTPGPPSGVTQCSQEDTDTLVQAIVNTIAYLSLFQKFKAEDGKLTTERQKFSEEKSFEPAREAIRTLTMLEEKQDALGPKINLFSTLISQADIKRFSSVLECPTLGHNHVLQSEGCFYYAYIKREFAQGNEETRSKILKTVGDKFFQLPQMKNKNPMLAETSLLALLFLLRQLFGQGPIADKEFLRRANNTVRQFFLWPRPHGMVAKATLEMLHREQCCPGYSLRERVLEQSAIAGLPEKLRSLFSTTTPPPTAARVIYYFLEEADDAAASGLCAMNAKKIPDEKFKSPATCGAALDPTTQAICLLSMMEGVGAAEVAKANALSVEELDSLWTAYHKVCADAGGADDTEQGMRMHKDGGAAMKAQLLGSAGTGGAGVELPEDCASGFLPPPVPFVHAVVMKKQIYTEMVLADTNAVKPPPVTPYLEPLKWLLTTVQERKQRPVELVLAVAGGSNTLHPLLCAYAHLRFTTPKSFRGVTVRFLLAPFSPSPTAAYLARHDAWYARHVYAPLRCNAFMLPWISVSETADTVLTSPDEYVPTPPGRMMRGLLEDYAREARATISIRVYALELWVDAEAEAKRSTADKVIPFSERLQFFVGQDSPPEVVVKFSKMDFCGNKSPATTNEPACYRSMELANTPIVGDRCWPADPAAPWLEMHSVSSNRRPASDPKQHVCDVDVTCTDRTGSFYLMVDGFKWPGHFHRARISQFMVQSPEGEDVPLTLPVAHFLPLA